MMTTGVTRPAPAWREFDRDSALPQEAVELRRVRKGCELNAAITLDLLKCKQVFSVLN
jgi:hypothetical protein